MRGKLCGVEFLAVALVLLSCSCVVTGVTLSCVEATVLSCVAGGSCVTGKVLGETLLQQAPGQGRTICTTLLPGNVVDVDCRTQDALVYDDPWWLRSRFSNGTATFTGWVADYYVDCGNVDVCNVRVCP